MPRYLGNGLVFVEPGDSQWSIAAKFTGDGLRWRELAPVNPKKATTHTGTFESLVPGEKLTIPESWRPKKADPTATDAALIDAAAGLDEAVGATAAQVTPRMFARALLEALDLPVTSNNVAAVIAWQAFEGGHWRNAAAYNPLNTTRQHGNSRPWGGKIPIQVFTTWDEGLEATALTLGQQNMTSIRVRLGMDADPAVTLQAIKENPSWGTFNLDPQAWRAAQAYGDVTKSTSPFVASLVFGGSGAGITPGIKVAHAPTPKGTPSGSSGFANVGALLGLAAVGLGLYMAGAKGRPIGYAVAAGGALVVATSSTDARAMPGPKASPLPLLPSPGLHASANVGVQSGIEGRANLAAGDLASDVVQQAREAAHQEAQRAAAAAVEAARGSVILAGLGGALVGVLAARMMKGR